jgi:hypothetical protein
MSLPKVFKGDTKDSLLEGTLYGGLRKELLAFDHPLKGLETKNITMNMGVAKFDVAKKELVVKEKPYEIKFNDEKGEGELKMTVKDTDMKGGFTNMKDSPKFWLAGCRSLGFCTVQTRVHYPDSKSELGLKSKVAGLDCAADMVFEAMGPPKTGIFGASYKLPLAMPAYVGVVAKYVAAKGEVDTSCGVFAKLPKPLLPGTDSCSLGAELYKSGAVLGGAKVVVDKTLVVQANCGLDGGIQASVVWSGLSAATVVCGYEGSPVNDLIGKKAIPSKFGLQVKLK